MKPYPYKDIYKFFLKPNDKSKFNGRLVELEKRFFFAHLCWLRLQDRSKRYRKILNESDVENILSNEELRKLHADEHFFFICCGELYEEIKYQMNNNIFEIPQELMTKLKVLKEERRTHVHGVNWYWGDKLKNNPPVARKGDNYNFDKNMDLLNEIYKEMVKSLNKSKDSGKPNR